jgi:pimeloyl-ACP methyl ester carboxylesterase
MLLIRGALSNLLSEDTLARMQTSAPDAITVTVPDVGHAPTLDEPEARAAIDALLAQVGRD